MAPKGQAAKGGKGGNAAAAKAAEKTFGMKNKGKSKAVQQIMKQAQGGSAQAAEQGKKKAELAKDAQAKALDALLFQEAVKKPKKREVKEEKKVVEVVEVEPTELEEKIEWQRARIKTRTPVTLERLQAWLQAKLDAKAAAESSKLGNAKAQLQHGKKAHGLTGRDLFSVDPTLFVDDAEANEDKLEERVGTDEESDGEEADGAVDAATSSTSSKASARNAERVDLVLGERVKAKYMGGKFWYEGTISTVHTDGTARIEYSDGDVEERVPRKLIELLEREPRKLVFTPSQAEAPAVAAGLSKPDSKSAAPEQPPTSGCKAAVTSSAAAPSAHASSAAVPTVAASQRKCQADAHAKATEVDAQPTSTVANGSGCTERAEAAANSEPAIDLENVDESLFLGEDLPDDDDV